MRMRHRWSLFRSGVVKLGCGRCVFAVNFRLDTVRCFSVVIVSLSLSVCRFIGFHDRNCWHNTVSVLNDVEWSPRFVSSGQSSSLRAENGSFSLNRETVRRFVSRKIRERFRTTSRIRWIIEQERKNRVVPATWRRFLFPFLDKLGLAIFLKIRPIKSSR